jgi:hypothetical protein
MFSINKHEEIKMLLIEEYITQSKAERQTHIDLTDPCVERGGPQKGGLSSYCKGLMAHLLDTTIPSGHKIHVCHACNNEKCSNPKHLYWGTSSENSKDRIANGDKSIWERMIDKYGLEEAKLLQSKGDKSSGGKANKGKPKSEEHKRKIALNHKGGRPKKLMRV